ncbi:MAG: hypothetical protein ABI843_02420 [Dokdonella sp.]
MIIGCVLLLGAFIAGRITGPSMIKADARIVASGQQIPRPVPLALPDDVVKFYDASDDVTCWRVRNADADEAGGISCLPQQWLVSARGAE